MKLGFTKVDMQSSAYQAKKAEWDRSAQLCFQINQLAPQDPTRFELIKDLLQGNYDQTNNIASPLHIDRGAQLHLGKNIYVNHSLTAVTVGGITIEDEVMIGPGVSLLTANHDFYNHQILYVAPIYIKKHAWIGAQAIILPGVTIGENAVIAAGAVVTKDVAANTVIGGNPGRVLKTFPEK